jgi:hypothetical protein
MSGLYGDHLFSNAMKLSSPAFSKKDSNVPIVTTKKVQPFRMLLAPLVSIQYAKEGMFGPWGIQLMI